MINIHDLTKEYPGEVLRLALLSTHYRQPLNWNDEIINLKRKYNINIIEMEEVDNYNGIDDLASLINACDQIVAIENLIPKTMRVVELGVPTLAQNRMWFKTYDKLLPQRGEIVFFDRSWYTRGLIQPAMGYCTDRQYNYFMKNVNDWEKKHIDGGLLLIKFYLSVSKENQQQRFAFRQNSPLKYWKLSENDLKAAKEWDLFTHYKEQVFANSEPNKNPWVIINSDNKMIARLNAMRYVLTSFEYAGKKVLKDKKWSKEITEYDIEVDGVKFKNLTKEQYELLYKLKGST